jgi:hypothetical protein
MVCGTWYFALSEMTLLTETIYMFQECVRVRMVHATILNED